MAILFLHGRLLALPCKLLNSKPSRRIRHNPAICNLALAVLLCFGNASAQADILPALVWNCWASGHNPAQINCIHKREQLPQPKLEDPDSELEAQLLGQLREKKRTGNTAMLEGVEWRNIDVVHKGARWAVKIHSYPQEKLLDESQLNKLVKTVLCTNGIPCTVTIRNTSQQTGETK